MQGWNDSNVRDYLLFTVLTLTVVKQLETSGKYLGLMLESVL